MEGTPSPDVIQFTIDLRHIVESAHALGLKLSPHEAIEATIGVRRNEAQMRGMVQQGTMLQTLAQQGKIEPLG